MNFLTAIFNTLIGFIKEHPILVTVIVLLAIGAPTLLQGIATFILYVLLFFIILVIVLVLMLRWRIYKVQRDVREQMRGGQNGQSGGNPFGGFGGFGTFGGFGQSRPENPAEGEVKVRHTEQSNEKRISDDVGDYVEFEETKEN